MKSVSITIVVALLFVFCVFFVPIWTKYGKGGNVYRVDTWTKIQLMMGVIKID